MLTKRALLLQVEVGMAGRVLGVDGDGDFKVHFKALGKAMWSYKKNKK